MDNIMPNDVSFYLWYFWGIPIWLHHIINVFYFPRDEIIFYGSSFSKENLESIPILFVVLLWHCFVFDVSVRAYSSFPRVVK